jgi:Cu-Zn family superoxide dismutase
MQNPKNGAWLKIIKHGLKGDFTMRIQSKMAALAIGGFFLLTVQACDPQVAPQPYPGPVPYIMVPDVAEAVAVLIPTEGNTVTGTINFLKMDSGIRVIGDISGLDPGKHGFHIHQYGNCSALDGTSAGGHFNPYNKPHGSPTDSERHVGDLGNIIADETPVAHYERIDGTLSFSGEDSIIGRSVVIHSDEDDFVTQPTGNAGSRVACGVIGIAAEE